jgi:hypothetical protein
MSAHLHFACQETNVMKHEARSLETVWRFPEGFFKKSSRHLQVISKRLPRSQRSLLLVRATAHPCRCESKSNLSGQEKAEMETNTAITDGDVRNGFEDVTIRFDINTNPTHVTVQVGS